MNLDVIYHRAQSWVDWSIRSSPKQYSIYLYCLCEERQRRSKLGGQGVVRSSERSPLPGASNSCVPWETSRRFTIGRVSHGAESAPSASTASGLTPTPTSAHPTNTLHILLPQYKPTGLIYLMQV